MILVRRPLVGLTLCHMTGLLLGRVAPADHQLLLSLGLGLLALVLAMRWLPCPSRPFLCNGLLLVVVMVVGWVRIGATPALPLDQALADRPAGAVQLVGVVDGDPVPQRGRVGHSYRFPLRVERGGWECAMGFRQPLQLVADQGEDLVRNLPGSGLLEESLFAITAESAGIDAHRDILTASFDPIRGCVLDRPAAGRGRAADECKRHEDDNETKTSLTHRIEAWLTHRTETSVTHHRDT